jgi:hypothetical protein
MISVLCMGVVRIAVSNHMDEARALSAAASAEAACDADGK